ncbi:MAG: hypothetical protein ACKVU1_10390 [bacterium]
MTTRWRLRCAPDALAEFAKRFSYADDHAVEEIGARAKKSGVLDRDGFVQLCGWKTQRSRSRCARNEAAFIKAVTRAALSSRNERFKIEALTLLDGVSWPTASVILHFCDRDPYPIVDFRALWSLGVNAPARYTFPFWREYCEVVRGLVARTGMSIRDVDRGLWQYSKERQRPRAT